jgi:phosphohistidine phosphatase
MKKLFLLRHAQAVNSINRDIDRVLSDEGILKCQDISLNLEPYTQDIDLVLSSSAIRTKQTIENVVTILGYSNINTYYTKELYNISADDLFQYLCNVEYNLSMSVGNIILVNHNPTISNLGSFLAHNSIESPTYLEILKGFSPGSLALYHANIESWDRLDQSNIILKDFWR